MLHVLLIHFNILSLLQFRGKRDGTLKEPTETAKIANIATQGNTIPMLVITNIENGNFSADRHQLFYGTQQFKTNLLQTFCKQLKYGMRDIHFDFESVAPEDAKRIIVFTKCENTLT